MFPWVVVAPGFLGNAGFAGGFGLFGLPCLGGVGLWVVVAVAGKELLLGSPEFVLFSFEINLFSVMYSSNES